MNKNYTFKKIVIGFASLFIYSGFVQATSEQSDRKYNAQFGDAAVLAIFEQVNNYEIEMGQLGLEKGSTLQIRSLAEMVVKDHTSVRQMGHDLAKKLGVSYSPEVDRGFIEEHIQKMALLKNKSGKEFDKAYLLHEMEFHQAVIDSIYDDLLPAVTNDELRDLIFKVLPGFRQHLVLTTDEAKKIGLVSATQALVSKRGNRGNGCILPAM